MALNWLKMGHGLQLNLATWEKNYSSIAANQLRPFHTDCYLFFKDYLERQLTMNKELVKLTFYALGSVTRMPTLSIQIPSDQSGFCWCTSECSYGFAYQAEFEKLGIECSRFATYYQRLSNLVNKEIAFAHKMRSLSFGCNAFV